MTNKVIHNYTQNRELSWLAFNQRVLEEARDQSVPLMERLKFVSIFTSNLDEFFMIRVGSLYDMVMIGDKEPDNKSGWTAKEQLEKIYDAVAPLYKKRDKIYHEIKKELKAYGVSCLTPKELEPKEQKFIRTYFKEQVLPVLSPQIVDPNHPFPHLLNKNIYVIANVMLNDAFMMGIVPVPELLPEVVYLPGHDVRYVRMESIIQEYMELIFEKYTVTDKNYICVTRNADISPDDENFDLNEDFRFRMKKLLHKRRRMAVVRLETALPLEPKLAAILMDKCKLDPKQVFQTSVPMKMDYVFSLMSKIPASMRRALLYPPFAPQVPGPLSAGNIIKQVRKHDILLSYPYESMEPFLQLIKEASVDPAVLTIKITIYRLAKKARLVEYLCAAAENGKEVTVLIELRARFDEQNNIDWSERLEEAGCRIIYGFDDYKVHSKVCLITLRGKNGIQYITQIGTGNYNENTAALYTDLSLMTADQGIGADAAAFFKNMSIGNLEGSYEHLLVAPVSLKQTVLRLMDEEIAKGSQGRIIMKMNSVTDYDFIEKLWAASRAGVRTDLIVRGICCILPGIAGETDHIHVSSIVGRFLEHSRIFSFGNGASQRLYIGSADMMTRNTERRVEVACPIYDPAVQKRINDILDIQLRDTVKARVLRPDGTYAKKERGAYPLCAQEFFMEDAMRSAQAGHHSEQNGKKGRWTRLLDRLLHRA